jgi:hypothetical protein
MNRVFVSGALALILGLSVGSVSVGLETAVGDDRGVDLDATLAARFAELALECVHREFPNKIAHVLSSPEDVKRPSALTPAFYGCFDWHSAVHGHWLLARLCRTFPEAPFVDRARAALRKSLTPEKIAVELAYLRGEGRASFERPYGLAWLLQLAAELHEWEDSESRVWARHLAPLEDEVARRFGEWLPKLSHPVRTGEHSQTAFALGLALDWSRSRGRSEMESLVLARAGDFYLRDRGASMSFEPDGEAFLSPILAEADLMRRVLPPSEFASWLGGFVPALKADVSGEWLSPAVVTDRGDGKLVHLDGLNLSRAWMLEGIASGLPEEDGRIAGLRGLAAAHRQAGLSAISNQQYEGGHWLGSFAVYLTTGRGL